MPQRGPGPPAPWGSGGRSSTLGPQSCAVPLTGIAARVCGEGLVPPASSSTAPFPLPSEFQVNGSLREETATTRFLAGVHLPLSPSPAGGGGTAGRASQSTRGPALCATGELVLRGPQTSSTSRALLRMPGGRTAGVWGRRRRWWRRSGRGLNSWSSPWLRAGGSLGVRCARQVSAFFGSRCPWWVGRGCGG